MGMSGAELAHRNAMIAAEYARGAPVEAIGAKYGITGCWVSRIAMRSGIKRRTARPTYEKCASITVYVPKSLHRKAVTAATARGITPGILLSRVARLTLSDKDLLDNVLDDGVQTEAAQ
jgi:hypothetical protein